MPDLIQRESTTANPGTADGEVRSLVTMIAKALVDAEDAVTVELSADDAGTVTLHLRAARSDIGKLIGQQGRTARSLRTILAAVGMKLRRRYALNIPDERTDAREMARQG